MDTKFFDQKILKDNFNQDGSELNKKFNSLLKSREKYDKSLSNNKVNNLEDNRIINKNYDSELEKKYKKKMLERDNFKKNEKNKQFDPTNYLHPLKEMRNNKIKINNNLPKINTINGRSKEDEDNVLDKLKELGIID